MHGCHLQVKWQVEPEGGEPFFRWWGATVVGPSSQRLADDASAPVYELKYDESEGDGFQQELCHAVFTSTRAWVGGPTPMCIYMNVYTHICSTHARLPLAGFRIFLSQTHMYIAHTGTGIQAV
jgi:hypothetical protein